MEVAVVNNILGNRWDRLIVLNAKKNLLSDGVFLVMKRIVMLAGGKFTPRVKEDFILFRKFKKMDI
jgi:hypothetical protein